MGYPLLTVATERTANDEGKVKVALTISQRVFRADGKTEGNNSLWQVPIKITTK